MRENRKKAAEIFEVLYNTLEEKDEAILGDLQRRMVKLNVRFMQKRLEWLDLNWKRILMA